MKHIHRLLLIAFFFTCLTPAFASVSKEHHSETHQESHYKEKFETGPFIMDHIADAYDWHVFSYGDFHFKAHLPVIVYSQHSGFHIFMSSKFHHGHSSYNGFELAKEGEYRGKVVEMVNGQQVRPFDISMTKNVSAMLISMIFLLWIFLSVAKTYTEEKD